MTILKGQSSVRERDEAEEWASTRGAGEEARLKLANDTLSYVVCGEHDRFGKVPGISIAGYMDVVTLDFRRDAERSSTNSVLVTVCTALENALLCPMLGGYDTIVGGRLSSRRASWRSHHNACSSVLMPPGDSTE